MDYVYSNEILGALLDAIPEYIFYRDLDGKNLYCNRSYAECFIGKPKSDIVGKSYSELINDKKIYNIARIKDHEVISTRKNVVYEMYINTANGDKLFTEITKIPFLDRNGEIVVILGIIKDISYKKEIDKLREGFFANIKHEFRTPLNMIYSSIQLLDNKCKRCDTCDCKECFINILQLININSLRILKLSDNFIELTNVQSGYSDFNPQNHDIISFTESICDEINNYKKFKDITLVFDTDTEEKIISFDINKIERVILNIISNAIKFSNYGAMVTVSVLSSDKYVEISVEDTGIGISEDKIDTIFDSFSYVEERLTKTSEGVGIGLALCKPLVEMHGGEIKVKSELGKGSKFMIRLPNIVNENEELDTSYNKIDRNSLERIKVELSDIYS